MTQANENLFNRVGQQVLRALADREVSAHISQPGMARDAAIPMSDNNNSQERQMPQGPRYSTDNHVPNMNARGGQYYGDQDPNNDPDDDGAPTDAQSCLNWLQKFISVLPPEECDRLVAGLQDIIETTAGAPNGNGNGQGRANVPPTGAGMDRVVAKNHGALDAQFAARGRRSADFLARWPIVKNISVR